MYGYDTVWNKKYLWLIATIGFAMVVNVSQAAIQGVRGTESGGQARISVTKSPHYEIRGLDDLSVTQAASRMSDSFCLYSEHPYYVKAAGQGANNALVLTNGRDQISYNALWKTKDGLYRLAPNKFTDVFMTGGKGCGQTTLEISLPKHLAMASSANYSGVLTLTIAPN